MNDDRLYLPFRLGRRLMLVTSVIGLVLALLLSGFSILQSYHQQTAEIERGIDEILKTSLPVLRETLWLGDTILLQSHLNGLKNHGSVALARIEREGRSPLSAGLPPPAGARTLERRRPIEATFRDRPVNLGTLVLVVDMDPVFAKFRLEALRILVSQLVVVAVIAGCILILYQRLVGTRLHRMAEFLTGTDPRALGKRLDTSRPGIHAEACDELDVLALAFNELLSRQDMHLRQLVDAGEKLEERVRQRTQELSEEVSEHERTRQELERSNRELEQFAYVVSHDLQEPLRTVASYVQLLQRRHAGQLAPDAAEYMDFAVDGAKRMQAMIRDLLDYSRITTKGAAFTEESLDEIFRAAVANLSAAVDEAEAAVASVPLPRVCCDRAQMIRLFQNLIGNAIKYQSQGRRPEVRVEAEPRDGEWVISVRDNGIGIAPRHFETIFQVFQRLHTREEFGGTGIGLAICKKIVERHGGRIWVDAEPGRGSTFSFSLPVAQG
ncbi:MAG: ATP-binding protein [Magnetospirillum sp. WYHS-4]